MPFRGEHACRLVDPKKFQPNSFKRLTRVSDGKDLGVIIGRLKDETTTTEQAFRYPTKAWNERAARRHCREHKGILFEPAINDDDRDAKTTRTISAARHRTRLHQAGLKNARARIDAGDVDETTPWSFTARDGDKLLGDPPDFERFARWHLGRDPDMDAKTKGAWKFPFGKDGKVFRSALRAIASRASQTGNDEISEAASGLIRRIDERKERQAESFLPNIATRVFNTPLLIDADKLSAILAVLGPRIGLDNLRALGEPLEPELPAAFGLLPSGIAVIPVTGTLVHRSFGLNPASGFQSYVRIEEMFLAAVDDPSVRGILFDINSPGGEAAAVFDLSDTIHAARGAKPIWATANETALSAAYAIASAADRIIVPRTGALGGIGVLAVHIDQSERDRKEGLKFSFITGGARKAAGDPHLPLDDEARSSIQAEVDRVFELFIDTVARNRQLSSAVIREMEGDPVFGANAVRVGLADDVATFKASIEALTQRLERSLTVMAGNSRRDRIMSDQPRLRAGEALARELNELIDARVTDDRSRGDIINDMAEEAGIGESTVNQILQAKIDCPPVDRLEGFARALDVSVDRLIEAGNRDGCEYQTSKSSRRATAKIVSLDEARTQARAETALYASQVVELCALAGDPALAAKFIADQTPLGKVREALVSSRADGAADAIVSKHVGQAPAAAQPVLDANEIYRRRAAAISR